MSFEAPRRGIELFRGIRAAERALLDRVAAWCATVRREPARLAAPFRVVVPSASLRAHLTDRITTEIGSVVGLEIVTMQALARAVVDRVAEPRGSTPRVADELVPVVVRQQAARIAALADELGALDDGYGCLVGTVSDLLDAGFEPALLEPCLESLEALALPARLRRRAGGILELAARVVQELERLGLARSAALMVRATGLVERAPESALPCSALIVYGIVDATGLATDWLAALVRHRDASVWIEHPADPADPGREDFGSRFTERLRERLGGIAPIEVASESDGAEAPGVLALCSAPGVQAEVRGVAERIAALVREGVRPESIGVVVRPVEVARPAIRTHFERLAIPFSGVGPTGPRAAVARRFDALLALLAQRERLPAERFLDVAEIGSRAERADLRVALHAQGVARMVDLARWSPDPCLVVDDRCPLPLRRGLASVGDDDPPSDDEAGGPADDEAVWEPEGAVSRRNGGGGRPERRTVEGRWLRETVARARAFLGAWDGGAAAAPLASHAERLRRALVDALGWQPATPGAATVAEVIAGLSDGAGARLSLSSDEFVALLAREIEPKARAPFGGAGGGVQVLDPTAARARTFEHLFVLGVTRGVWPRVLADDPILPDDVRRALGTLLQDLPIRSRARYEEHYLFAELVGASPRVTLSWQTSDEDGKAQAPSPFVERLLASGRAPEVEGLQVWHGGGPRGPNRQPAHEKAVIAGLYGSTRLHGRLFAGAAQECAAGLAPNGLPEPGAWAAARMAVLREFEGVADRRGGPAGLGPFFGFVGPAAESNDLRRQPIYVTRLEHYSRCAWQAFLVQMLGIEPAADSLSVLPSADPRLVGSVVHAALEEIAHRSGVPRGARLDEIATEAGRPVVWPEADELEACTVACAERVLRRDGIGQEGFARLLARIARPYLERVGRHLACEPDASRRVLGVEVEGVARVALGDDAEARDDGATTPPGAPRMFPFRADWVEREGDRIRLIDVKTGRPPRKGSHVAKRADTRGRHWLEAVGKGRHLQALAYAAAETPGGTGGSWGRFLYLAPDLSDDQAIGDMPSTAPDLDVRLEEAFRGVLGRIFRSLETGALLPRLVESEKEAATPRHCQACEMTSACLQGDSGLRARFHRWLASDPASEAAPERAARESWGKGGS